LVVGAYVKQSDGGVSGNSALYQTLEKLNLKVPEGTILPHRKITLPHIFVGDKSYPLTTYRMKPYSRRTLDRSKAISRNYRPSRAGHVVE